MAKPNGLVLWRGRSRLTRQPIVCVLTGLRDRSVNEKTGDMLQTWILYQCQPPGQAIRTGNDRAVCGTCPLRGAPCYVDMRAPSAVWGGLRRGIYPAFDPRSDAHLFRRRLIRLGSYGDPAALPYRAWADVLRLCAGRVGYTHAWRTCDQRYRDIVMASADTPADRAAAVDMGWRTFRIRLPEQPLMPGEFTCPASVEAGRRLDCSRCLACDGRTASGRGASPAVLYHGSPVAGRHAERLFRTRTGQPDPSGRLSLL